MTLLHVEVQKDSATKISKDVTLEEAQALATRFTIQVATADGFIDWADFLEVKRKKDADAEEAAKAEAAAAKKAAEQQAALALDSLLKRQKMTKAAFSKLPQDEQDRMLVEETALMASEAEAAKQPAGGQVAPNGTGDTAQP